MFIVVVTYFTKNELLTNNVAVWQLNEIMSALGN